MAWKYKKKGASKIFHNNKASVEETRSRLEKLPLFRANDPIPFKCGMSKEERIRFLRSFG